MADVIIERHYRNQASYVASQVLWTLLGILETLLAIQFLLRLFGANPGAGFTQFINFVATPFVAPFSNVFRAMTLGSGVRGVWDWAPLLGMVVYWLVIWAVDQFLKISEPADDHVDYVKRV